MRFLSDICAITGYLPIESLPEESVFAHGIISAQNSSREMQSALVDEI
jgi:hypothetical protein